MGDPPSERLLSGQRRAERHQVTSMFVSRGDLGLVAPLWA